MQKRCRVGVIYGGRSGEHEVSLVSAASVMRAIDRERFDVVPIAIDKNGRWLRAQFDGTQAVATGEPVALLTDPTNPRLVSLAGERVERSTSSSPSCTVP